MRKGLQYNERFRLSFKEEVMPMNNMECGKCGYFDGMCCRKTDIERDEDEIVVDCNSFEMSIYV